MKEEVDPLTLYPPDFLEWIALTPAERAVRTGELWRIYLAYGGSLDPDPDPQSPFFDSEAPNSSVAHGGTSLRIVRRS